MCIGGIVLCGGKKQDAFARKWIDLLYTITAKPPFPSFPLAACNTHTHLKVPQATVAFLAPGGFLHDDTQHGRGAAAVARAVCRAVLGLIRAVLHTRT